jgi:hypothetical protein
VPEPILRILDYVAPGLIVLLAVAIPAFAIVAIPHAIQKCAHAPKRARRPFRVRVRIWQLMVAVLVVGAVFEFAIMARQAHHAHKRAVDHAREAWGCRWLLGREEDGSWFFKFKAPPLDGIPGLVEYFQSLERHHEALSQKYHDIARHPWSIVSGDPPEPKMPDNLEFIGGPEYAAFVNAMKALARLIADSQ